MDWTDFAQRLTRELTHLPVDAFLIVQGPGGLPYVQAMRYLNGLHAEAVSSDYLPEPLDSAQELRLSELGWQAPDGRARRNWWCRVALPADLTAVTPDQAAECGALADRMVAAFRDVYGMPSVAGLTYEASRNGDDAGPVPMPGLGIPAADDVPSPAGAGLSWAEFAERLARELAAMEPEMVLVIPHRLQESHYVQAFRDLRRVRAEAVSERALPPSAPRLDAREEERLTAVGWRPPGEHPNWTHELPADADPEEYRRLAAMMVTALRDVQLAHSPADLVYEAFIGASHVELTEFGISTARPGRVDARRASPPLPRPAAAEPPPAAGPPAAEPPGVGSPGVGSPGVEPVVAGSYAAHAVTPSAPPAPAADIDIEEELTAAKSRGDQPGYLGLVLRAELFVPVTEGEQPVTATFRDGTYVLAYTSPEAMDWALGGKLMDYRRTTFTELACNWPRPDWQLAINSRLPSSAYIDTGTIQRTAERAGGRRAPHRPPAPPPSAPEPAMAPPPPVPETTRTPAGTAPLVDAGSAAPAGDAPVAGAAAAPTAGTSVQPGDRPVAGTSGKPVVAGASARTPGKPVAETPAQAPGKPVAETPAQAPGKPVAGAFAQTSDEPIAGVFAQTPDEPIAEAAAAPAVDAPAAAPAPSGSATRPAAGPPVTAGGGPLQENTVMQKVIRPDHVVHYLDGGYDWVAGRIYRLQDVSDLMTPAQLVRALGLDHEGSPFSADDVEVFVIRWPVLKPALVRVEEPPAGSAVPAFRIGSQRLPHGAEMFGIDRLGTESFLAVYDADIRGWIRTEAG